MAAMLRLGSRERSSFLFKKSVQQNPDDISAVSDFDPVHGLLPNIAHVDTRSFVGLFDRYQNTNSGQTTTADQFSHASPSAKDFAWPVASPLHTSSIMLNSHLNHRAMPSPQRLDNGCGSGLVVRNDSTGSSSVALSRNSDDTPPMTRNSSCSSIMDPPSPFVQKISQSQSELTAISSVERSSNFHFELKSRASTWGPSTSTISQSLDLDKPLPPLQHIKSRDRSQQKLAPTTRALVPSTPSKYPSMRRHNRSASVPLLLAAKTSGSISELPGSSPPTSRGVRLGRAMANPVMKQRSRSSTLMSGRRIDAAPAGTRANQQPDDQTGRRASACKSQKHSKRVSSKPISSRTAEQVIYRIMCQLDDVKDLQAAALVSKGFLNTYQRNESKLVSHLVFKSSRPAWELRRSILSLRGSKAFRLNDYMRDVRTIKALKGFILGHCSSTLKSKTIAGLIGQDHLCELEVENALWRIWTFCVLFGENAAQTPVPPAEIAWLNGSNGFDYKALGAGFAVGNGTGLSADELEDLMEMWTCLQMLLSQFHGREDEAQRVGVLDNWQANSGISKEQHLREWTSYLLTLGPQVILSLSSASFDRAKMFGLTRWAPPPFNQTRSLFLTSAISHVYQERILAEATAKAAQIALPRMSSTRHRPSKSVDFVSNRQKSLRLDTSVVQRRPVSDSTPSSAPPTELRPDCDPASSIPSMPRASALFPASPTNDPTIFHTLSMTATASTKLGATLFPMDYGHQAPRVPFPTAPTRAPPPPPGIVDPIDRHLNLLVQELGFNEHKAKRALAMCDTGSGIDIQQAIEVLMVESRRESSNSNTPIELPTPISVPRPLRLRRQKKDICTGECKRMTSTSINTSIMNSRVGSMYSRHSGHTRSGSIGPTPAEDVPISPITDIYGGHSDAEDNASEIRREELDMVSPLASTPIFSGVRRMGTKKAWKVLGAMEQDPIPQKLIGNSLGRSRSRSQGVVGMEEYEKRIERRKSQRLMQQAQQQDGSFLKTGLQENLKGLGLGGLGGLRVIERELTSAGKGKSKFRRQSSMPVSAI